MIGQTIAHYTITEKIGQGGMGEVYRATDTKLKRDVALKVLPQSFTQDPQRMTRFTREAQVLASLNHPNIGAIHGLEEEGGVRALVLELIEGEDLSEHIAKGPIPLEEALKIALQIAEAVEAAHEKGIIHRDLKPANVKITPEGQVKVLDFGLAKALEEGPTRSPDMTQSPTLTMQATQAGIILGTAAYMSPEQARGIPADVRSDIWGFGVILFEMLTARKAFQGEDITLTLASVVKEEPEWDLLPKEASSLRRVLARCLAKEPRARFHHIADVRIAIEESLAEPSTRDVSRKMAATSRSFPPLAWLPVMLVAVLLAVWLTYTWKPEPEPVPPLTASLRFEAESRPTRDGYLALSPDGERLAFVTPSRIDGARVWIRSMRDGTQQPIAGTEGAERPFWSPDGSRIGYFAKSQLWVVPAAGGPSNRLASATFSTGASWNGEGAILYSPSRGALFQVPEGGGTPTQVTTLGDGAPRHESPHFLPDGRRFLFSSWPLEGDQIHIGDLESDQIKSLRKGRHAQFVPPGLLVFLLPREGVTNRGGGFAVYAQEFDPDEGTLSGQAVPLISRVNTPGGYPILSVTNQRIVFQGRLREDDTPGQTTTSGRVWMRRSGEFEATPVQGPGWVFRISHDGSRVALAGFGLSIHDLARDVSEQVPTEAFPVAFSWSPDDSQIVYASNRSERSSLRVIQLDGKKPEETIYESDRERITYLDWSRDGKHMLLILFTGERNELWVFNVATGEASRVFESDSNFFTPNFAPNGQWYAYATGEIGATSVQVRPFPGPGAPITISPEGGAAPRWSGDGRELFYITSDARVAVVTVEFGDSLVTSQPVMLAGDPLTDNPSQPEATYFDVHPDGQRLLVRPIVDGGQDFELTVLENWQALLKPRAMRSATEGAR